MALHVVNNAMAIKAPGVWFWQLGDPRERDAVWRIISVLDAFTVRRMASLAAMSILPVSTHRRERSCVLWLSISIRSKC
jgi:hypothetical protein